MVRISEATRKQRLIKKHYSLNTKLLNRHFFHFFILSLVLLFVALYFFLLSAEKREDKVVGMAAAARSAARIIAAGKPFLIYGTAWKKDLTARYVTEAVRAGFRFIDTACQPKHYNEAGVGEGWTQAAQELGLHRSDLFLQTKFSPADGQDHDNIPYDPSAPLEDQVKQSLDVSLKNLKTKYLDSLLLHSPLHTMEDTMTVWRQMESFVDSGQVLRLGISNCYDYKKFTSLYEMARVKPSVLQNRFYHKTAFDTELRAFCKSKGIWYQSFWTLTANRHALDSPEAREWAEEKGLTPQTLMFAFLMSLGYVTPLSGTTSPEHMEEDVSVMEHMQGGSLEHISEQIDVTERSQGGEVFFKNEEELRRFAQLLGMPDL